MKTQNNKYNYVVMNIVSKFHLYGAVAYCNEHNLLNDTTRIIVIRQFHILSNKFRVDNNDCDKFFHDSYELVDYYSNQTEKLSEIIVSKINFKEVNKLYFIGVMNPPYLLLPKVYVHNKFHRIYCASIDEGTASYISTKRIVMMNTVGKKHKNLTVILKNNIFYQGIRVIIFGLINFFMIKENEKLFLMTKTKNGYTPNDYTIGLYRKVFNLIKMPKLKVLKEPSVIFLSDCLKNKIKNPDAEAKILNNVVKQIKNKLNCKSVYFKPHPNEMQNLDYFKENLNCNILTENISAEELFNNNDIVGVVSFSSTALITAALFFDIKTVSYAKSIMDELSDEGVFAYNNIKKLATLIPNLDV